MKIYTGTGDQGETSLAGGSRVPKNDVRIEAYGSVDELNSYIGLIRVQKINDDDKAFLEWIQNCLMTASARCVCRRAERKVLAIDNISKKSRICIRYLNRLSDYLFVLSRKLTKDFKIIEIYWQPCTKK